ncbi:MAG: HlyD family efflux transporter periplasmic adaptor subunit [Paludibacter sp.]|nr:HlyD family efflux transporter periplasmic adaptor subunit [Paludibacter sp.]
MKTNKATESKFFCCIRKYTFLSIAIPTFLTSCGVSKDNYDASGTFETTEVLVSAEGSGKILSFDVREGQVLAANEVVGTIDSMQLFLRKKQMITTERSMQVRRPNVQKQIAAIEQQIATAKTERKRIENLIKADAANQKQLDDVNAQISVLEKQLDAQKTTLVTTNQGITDDSEGIKLQVAQLEDQLNKCKITSPIAGTVLVKYSEQGEVAAPGKALFKIADTNNMILRAYVTNGQLSKLKIGQKVKVYCDSDTKEMKEYEGTLGWISDKSEFTPKTIQTKDERANLVYAVKINVKNDGFLKIGMYGSVKF